MSAEATTILLTIIFTCIGTTALVLTIQMIGIARHKAQASSHRTSNALVNYLRSE